MCKKLAMTVVAASIAAFILFGTSAFSHLSHGVGWVRGQVEENVPVQYKLEKARKAIKTAEPKIRQYNRDIAEKQVEIRYLERELSQLSHEATTARMTLKDQWETMKVQKASYTFLGSRVSHSQMRQDAALRLRRVKAADQMVASKSERLNALQSGLKHIHEALGNLGNKREELITLCDVLEAKMRETEAKKAATLDIEVDHSDLAKAAEILASVEKQLDVEMQVMRNNRPLLGESQMAAETPIDLNAQISSYLDGESESVTVGRSTENGLLIEGAVSTSLVEVR
ncbi:MAG: chromosome segregation ATPase [Planctomycetota bacterium]|jgi:chromosome segregation ATPase